MRWEDLQAHSADLRGWLDAGQPRGESRSNWWLGWVLAATGQIQSVVSVGEVPDSATLDLAVQVINLATDESAVDSVNRAIRLANLASLIAQIRRDSSLPPELRPDIAARQCLALISEHVAEVEISATDWRSLPVEEIGRLRAVKNLVTPVLRLAPYLKDRNLADEIARWSAVLPQLP
jgi:hypothetical protein